MGWGGQPLSAGHEKPASKPIFSFDDRSLMSIGDMAKRGIDIPPNVPQIEENVQHWGVDIRINGENILSIESKCLFGRNLSVQDEVVIREAARHLLAFVGNP